MHEATHDARVIASVAIDSVINAAVSKLDGLISPKSKEVGQLGKAMIESAIEIAMKDLKSRKRHARTLPPETEAFAKSIHDLHARLADAEP